MKRSMDYFQNSNPTRDSARKRAVWFSRTIVALGASSLTAVAMLPPGLAQDSSGDLFQYDRGDASGPNLFDMTDDGGQPAPATQPAPGAQLSPTSPTPTQGQYPPTNLGTGAPTSAPGLSTPTGLSAPTGGAPATGEPLGTQLERTVTPPGAGGSAAADNRYRLGSGDTVNVDIFGVPEFSGEQQVLPDGTINLTLLGTVPVEGMTLQEAADYIATQYSSYLNSPIVNLRIVTPRAVRIAVAGEVNRPGPYTLSDGDRGGGGGGDGPAATPVTTTVPTVTSLIQQAGGITSTADVRNVQVKRPLPNGNVQTFDIDLWKMTQEGDLSQDMKLLDGDTVVVAKADRINSDEAQRIAAANFSPAEITVNVVGEVETPGPVQLRPNTPLNQAILAAGGVSRRGSKSNVGLLRLNPDGTVSQRKIDLDYEAGTDGESNPLLKDTDVIVVGRSGATLAADVIGTALSPLVPFGQIFGIYRDIDNTFN